MVINPSVFGNMAPRRITGKKEVTYESLECLKFGVLKVKKRTLYVKYDSAGIWKIPLVFPLFQNTLYTYLWKTLFIEETKNRVFFRCLVRPAHRAVAILRSFADAPFNVIMKLSTDISLLRSFDCGKMTFRLLDDVR